MKRNSKEMKRSSRGSSTAKSSPKRTDSLESIFYRKPGSLRATKKTQTWKGVLIQCRKN